MPSREDPVVNADMPNVRITSHDEEGSAAVQASVDGSSGDDILGLGRDEDVPPPLYSETYGQFQTAEDGTGTGAAIADDGRVNVRINQQSRGLSSLMVPALRSQLDLLATQSVPHIPSNLDRRSSQSSAPPALNVVIHVVGSRGDVQPFVALGKVLKEVHHHRVRLATHPVFKDFVEEHGLEFFSISGDPAELMAFMVKNPGLMPGFETLRKGDVGRRRKDIGIMLRGCWRSCIETGDGTGVEASDKNMSATVEMFGTDPTKRPFVADAIIANPPSFAHIHCAEKLGIPLHMMFTMPWSPTQAFPHPLANIQATNTDASMTNLISYGLVDLMQWQGLGDVINRFRQKVLALEPLNPTWAPGMLSRLRIPYTYCWSPALIPKPRDWAHYITISGFYFLNLASNYAPAPELAAFLQNGPPPVYIGFGSVVVDDPDALTKLIFEAVKKTGQRALVSKGWGGFGADQIGIPDGVLMLGNVPHDWLFKHVSAVVHHGGAGTTAAGITSGKPTIIVPFFGDQPFWGAMIARAGAGPSPIPFKQLTAEKLAEAIMHAIEPSTVEKAKELGESIKLEKGTEAGAESFHRELDLDKMKCVLCPSRVAVWRLRRTEVRLSAFAAAVLGHKKLIKFSDLKLNRPQEHHTEDEPFDPVTGGASALVNTMGSMAMGIFDMPVSALKALGIHPGSDRPKTPNNGSSRSPKPTSPKPTSPPPAMKTRTNDSATSSLSPDRDGQPEAAPVVAAEVAQAAVVGNPGQPLEGSSKESSFDVDESNSNLEKKPASRNLEDLIGTGKGILRFASAGIKSPMDFSLGLARGFHNAPKLYGDETVRKSDKVTDFSSGLKAAGREFGFGMYDGISGLVSQPYEGAKKEGASGFIKGVGKGVGGLVLKPGAAIWGLPGYTSQGIYKELQKRFGPSVQNYIIASRTAQGYEAMRMASDAEVEAVVRTWKELKPYIRKKKTLSEVQKDSINEMRLKLDDLPIAKSRSKSRSRSEEPRPGLLNRIETDDSGIWSPVDSLSRAPTQTLHQTTSPEELFPDNGDADLEEAIMRSVRETSKGDADEDILIERAIRASIAELRAAKARGANDADLNKAMEESIREATLGLRHGEVKEDAESTSDEDEVHDKLWNEELERALRESEDEHKTAQITEEEAKREEEIVMKYVMKQSLLEEEMRQRKQAAAS